MCRAAARGLAAPKLLTMRMPCSEATRQHGAQHRVEQRLVAGFGVGAPAKLRQGQRAFGEGFKNEEGTLPGRALGKPRDQRVNHRAGRIGPVT